MRRLGVLEDRHRKAVDPLRQTSTGSIGSSSSPSNKGAAQKNQRQLQQDLEEMQNKMQSVDRPRKTVNPPQLSSTGSAGKCSSPSRVDAAQKVHRQSLVHAHFYTQVYTHVC